MKKKILICGVILLLLIVVLPLAIDWIVIGNNFPSNIGNSEWVGFLGAYIGALIGAAVSLAGIVITIRYTNDQNDKNRELQVRPYCTFRYVHDNKLVGTNKIIAELPIGCEPKENNGPRYTSILYIKNIGLGPAVEFDFSVDEILDDRQHYLIFMQQNEDVSNRRVNHLAPGDEAAFPIYFYFNFDKISANDFFDYDEDTKMRGYGVKYEIMQKYKNFDVVIHMKYYDMFNNQYYQKITLSSNMYISEKPGEKKAEHKCDIYLKEITAPVKMRLQTDMDTRSVSNGSSD